MTQLINAVVPRTELVSAAAQTVFTVPFPFFEDADLAVYVDGTLQTLSTHYSVSGAGTTEGGSVTFGSGLSSGQVVVIVREIAIERVTDFPTSGPFSVLLLNTELDRLTAMLQELNEASGRSLVRPVEAEADEASFEAGGRRIADLAEPVDSGDAATMAYVDARVQLVGDLEGAETVTTLGSRTDLAAASFTVAPTYLRTAGYAQAGDGGDDLFVKVATPGTVTRRHVQTADGTWYQSCDRTGNPIKYGAKGDGSTDDAVALQAAFDLNAGKWVEMDDGVYCTSVALKLPANTSLFLSPNTTLKATAAMTALLYTGEASDYSDTHRNSTIQGGIFDCNALAQIGLWLKHFEKFNVQNIDVVDAALHGMRLGSTTAPSASYELFMNQFRVRRTIARGAAVANSRGIDCQNVGDSHIENGIINGVKYGMAGSLSDSKLEKIHVWNNVEHGAAIDGFTLSGFSTSLDQCQVDGPFSLAAYDISGQKFTLDKCQVNADASGQSDNVADAFFFGVGSTGHVTNPEIKAGAARRLARDFGGTLTGWSIIGNDPTYCVSTTLDQAPGLIACHALVNMTGAVGVLASGLVAGRNVSSIEKLATGKIRINWTRSLGTADYVVQATGRTDGGANNGINAYVASSTAFATEITTVDSVTGVLADTTRLSVCIVK